MPSISKYSYNDVSALLGKIGDESRKCASLEEAAQKCVELLYREFEPSIALARLYATVPFKGLPAPNQAFVNTLAAAKGITQLIKNETLVLSLLGTYGAKPGWNDRRKSQGHVGIPLAATSFVESIPMVSRLLKEMGIDPGWIDKGDTGIVANVTGKMAGLFYVQDAKVAVDQQGRKIITAQDFVTGNGIKTVFGVGGGYVNGTFITLILFTRETIEKPQAEMFTSLVNAIKSATMTPVTKGRIFA